MSKKQVLDADDWRFVLAPGIAWGLLGVATQAEVTVPEPFTVGTLARELQDAAAEIHLGETLKLAVEACQAFAAAATEAHRLASVSLEPPSKEQIAQMSDDLTAVSEEVKKSQRFDAACKLMAGIAGILRSASAKG